MTEQHEQHTIENTKQDASNLQALRDQLAELDKASEILSEAVTIVPTATQQAVNNLRDVVEANLKSIEKQLDAHKEAVLLAEKNLSEKIDDLKERILVIETREANGT